MLQIITRKKPIQKLAQLAPQTAPTELPLGVHLGDLLTPDFISRHSRFAAEDEMFTASGFRIQSAQDFADIPDDLWDQFIGQNTVFESWSEMLQSAKLEWLLKNPGMRSA